MQRDCPLSYCGGGAETFRRLRDLYERRSQDMVSAAFQTPSPALQRLARRQPPGFCQYPDPRERAEFWDEYLAERAGVRDDSVPAAYLSELDQGLYGGLLGGDVRFLFDPGTGWVSSMVPPLFDEISQVRELAFGDRSPWWRRYLEQLDVFADRAAGRFGISHFILIDGLNFVFELIGATKAYLALVDAPDDVRRAIDFAFDLNFRVQEAFFDRVGLPAGGTCSNAAGWLPGAIVSESVDPFHMTSVADFERWGRGPVERIFRAFDGGVLHIHGNGRHLLGAVATLPRLKCIYLGDDRGYPPAFEALPELKARTGEVPLTVAVGYERFCAALDRGELLGGVRYVVADTPSADAANRTMDRLRAYRP